MKLEVVRSMRPHPATAPKPPPAPAPPLIPDSGIAQIDAIADCVNTAADPFRNAPDPEKGTLGVIEHGIGAVMGVVGAPFQLLDTGFAMATSFIAALLPGFPAAVLGMPHFGPPHGHLHPPSLIPPNPVPVPLPSIGMISVPGAVNVLIGGLPAARAGDIGMAPTCVGLFPLFDIFTGSSNTWIAGSRAARMGDITWHCNPASAMNKIGKVMGAIGVAAGAVSAGAAAAAGQAAAAAAAAAQAAADAVALAMGAMLGKDPGVPPTIGAIMMGYPMVLIGGFPMPDTLAAIGGLLKGLKMLGKAIGKSKGLGKLLSKVGLCNAPGEPINPFTGEVYNDFEDYHATDTGFVWERHYRSGWNDENGPLGYGFRHFYQRSLNFYRKRAIYETHDNEQVALERNDDGTFQPIAGFSLRSSDGRSFELKTDRDETLTFTLIPGSPPTGRLDRYIAPGVDIYLYYDERGQLRAISELTALGPVDTLCYYGNDGYIAEVHRGVRGQAPASISRYVYKDGCLVEWYDATGSAKRFRYDGERRMVQGTDRRGYSFHWEYDPRNGRCIKSYGDDGLWGVEAKYDGSTSIFTELDGSQWTYKFFPDGTTSHLVGPDGEVLQYIRDEETGRIVKQIEPGGQEFTWLYDATGKHFGRIDPYGNLVPPEDEEPNPNSLSHDGPNTNRGFLSGRPLAALVPAMVEPPAPVAQQLAHMEALSPWFGDGKPRAMQYDATGQLLEEQEPDGSVRRFHYDAEGDRDAELLIPADARRQPIVAQSPRQGWWTRQYTSFSLLSGEMTPLGHATRYEYTHRENWRAIVDPNGNRTEYVRDGRHRIAEIRRFGGVHRRYVHDAHDAVIEEQDANGNALVKYETGPTGLHTSAVLASGEQYTYAYDSRGQFTEASSSAHKIIQRHVGQKLASDQRDGKGVEHEYGTALRVTRSKYFDRFKIRYDYLATHQLRITSPDGSTHTLWNAGNRIIRENGNGTSEALSFDAKERLCARAAWHGDSGNIGPFWSSSYRYDAAGSLIGRIDTESGAEHFEYDADDRLVLRHRNDVTEAYSYDAAGNLVRTPRLGQVDYAVGNLLRRAALTHYTDDERFRRATKDLPGKSLVQYSYDSLDQLTEARLTADGKEKLWRAAYDGLGRRIWREIDCQRTDFYWDNDRLAAEHFPDGKLRLYVYPNEDALVPFMWVDYESEEAPPESGKAYYLFTEPSGMPVRVEDAKGNAVWQAAKIDPYGHLEGEGGAECPTRLRFAGHFHDEDLGLFYNRFRDYDPEVGRYLQPDPLGHAGGINLFAYSSNPLVEVDLRGLVHKPKKPKGADGDGQNGGKKPSEGERPKILKSGETSARRKGLVRKESPAGQGFPPGTRKVTYGDPVTATYHVDSKGRILRAEGVLDPPADYDKIGPGARKPDGFESGRDDRGHLIPERSAADQDNVNVPENIIAENATQSNRSTKSSFEGRAQDYSAENPGTRMVSEPHYDGDNPRPTSVTHTLVDESGNPITDKSVLPNPQTIANPE